MSTPLLSEVIPEIDAKPVSFNKGGGVEGWSLGSLQSTENKENFMLPLGTKS